MKMITKFLAAANVAALVGGVLLAAATAEPTQAPPFHFELYMAEPGDQQFSPAFRAGPFNRLVDCYSLAAIGIDVLVIKHPTTTFAGRCEDGPLLTPPQITRRAFELLPTQ